MPRLRPIPKKQEEPEKIEAPEENQLFEAEAPEAVEFEAKPAEVKKVEPEVIEEKKEDPTLALQKQLDELRKSEEMQRTQREQAIKDRDEAIKRAEERQTEVIKFQKEATQSQYDSVATALAAANSEAEAAKRDIKSAIANADADLQADAYERLATARANISKLEDGKFELESRLKAERAKPPEPKPEPKQEQPKQLTVEQVIDSWKLPDITTNYLKSHQEYVRDPIKFDSLKYWNHKAAAAGLAVHSQAFLDYVDGKMKLEDAPKEEPKEQQRTNIVSAPVSREVPNGSGQRPSNGKVTLSPEEKEAAKMSGITETEYARQKMRLQEMKANGTYGDRQ